MRGSLVLVSAVLVASSAQLWKWDGTACRDVSATAACTCDATGRDCARLFHDDASCLSAYGRCRST